MTSARSRCDRCATTSASCRRTRCCSPARSPTTSATDGSTPAKDEIVAAATAANAHDFISRLPGAYQSSIGERGVRLSGGERQRICIARAFLKNAAILILDEPTASIDSRTEAVILEALDRLMAGPDDVHDRAPAVDDPSRGPDPRDGPRRDRRARDARGAAARERCVRAAARRADRPSSSPPARRSCPRSPGGAA